MWSLLRIGYTFPVSIVKVDQEFITNFNGLVRQIFDTALLKGDLEYTSRVLFHKTSPFAQCWALTLKNVIRLEPDLNLFLIFGVCFVIYYLLQSIKSQEGKCRDFVNFLFLFLSQFLPPVVLGRCNDNKGNLCLFFSASLHVA